MFLTCILSFLGCKKSKNNDDKKFKEPLNTAVFTTKFVVEDKKTITYVTRDAEDGDWQFFSNDEYENFGDVAKLVSLGNILKLDPTLIELCDLPIGYYAERKDASENWRINKHE